MINQCWFRKCIVADRQETITWAITEPDLFRHMASQGHNEFIEPWWSWHDFQMSALLPDHGPLTASLLWSRILWSFITSPSASYIFVSQMCRYISGNMRKVWFHWSICTLHELITRGTSCCDVTLINCFDVIFKDSVMITLTFLVTRRFVLAVNQY